MALCFSLRRLFERTGDGIHRTRRIDRSGCRLHVKGGWLASKHHHPWTIWTRDRTGDCHPTAMGTVMATRVRSPCLPFEFPATRGQSIVSQLCIPLGRAARAERAVYPFSFQLGSVRLSYPNIRNPPSMWRRAPVRRSPSRRAASRRRESSTLVVHVKKLGIPVLGQKPVNWKIKKK